MSAISSLESFKSRESSSETVLQNDNSRDPSAETEATDYGQRPPAYEPLGKENGDRSMVQSNDFAEGNSKRKLTSHVRI